MHGVINRSLECFLRDTFGAATWDAIAREAEIGGSGFEAMLAYDDAVTTRLVASAAQILRRQREAVLEDLGTYLVSTEGITFLRRLLRFSGVNFVDFVNSLEELPERARMVLPELDVPQLELSDLGGGHFNLTCLSAFKGAEHVVMGILRAMADDYGALVLLDVVDGQEGTISIQVADHAFSAARPFSLGQTL